MFQGRTSPKSWGHLESLRRPIFFTRSFPELSAKSKTQRTPEDGAKYVVKVRTISQDVRAFFTNDLRELIYTGNVGLKSESEGEGDRETVLLVQVKQSVHVNRVIRDLWYLIIGTVIYFIYFDKRTYLKDLVRGSPDTLRDAP